MSSESFEPRRLTAPFSASDTFVYLIPGATLFISIFFIEQFLKEQALGYDLEVVTPFGQMLWTWGMQVVAQPSILYSVTLLLVLLTAVYIGGHLLSSISSFCIDRVLVHHGHQYPYALFLGRRKRAMFSKPQRSKEAFYRGLFFWPNMAVLCVYLTPWFVVHPIRWWFLTGMSVVSVAVVFTLLVGKLGWHSVRRHQKIAICAWLIQTYERRIVLVRRIASGPYDILANVFSSVLSAVREPLVQPLLDQYRSRFESAFGIKPDDVGSLNFWLPYIYIMRRAPDLHRLIMVWHYQYELARNIATAFFISALYAAVLVLHQTAAPAWQWPQQTPPPEWMNSQVFWLPLIFMAASYLMLSRYYYIYVCYYNRFIFRAFVFAHQHCQPGQDPPQIPSAGE